ncbi:hypothetical protein [Paractinoplanes lichenicola]|uniref:Uncharacterized protein n=1 Tax=Paractinoplanes lichenicola TaxID=2802976 RepID=A0ABS1VXM3_9ACTN|nr:hypothetical protein [Actinoplanes lichenicola]MBL7259251.1 hypothetical protein [Actinoplanes lichenicola]
MEQVSWPVGGIAPESVPPALAHACDLVGSDLAAAGVVAASGDTWWAGKSALLSGGAPAAWVVGLGDGRKFAFGFGVDLSGSDAGVVALVAEGVQTHLAGYEFVEWPRCPRHRGPMAVAVEDVAAVWACRGARCQTIPIGAWSPT